MSRRQPVQRGIYALSDTPGAGTARALFLAMRFILPTLALAFCIGGFTVVADALVTSDAEHIETFLEQASDTDPSERADAVASYLAPDEVPVRVSADGEAQLFGAGQGDELVEWTRGQLENFGSSSQRLLQDSTRITGPDQARVTTRMSDGESEQTAIYHLVKRDGAWRIQRMRVL